MRSNTNKDDMNDDMKMSKCDAYKSICYRIDGYKWNVKIFLYIFFFGSFHLSIFACDLFEMLLWGSGCWFDFFVRSLDRRWLLLLMALKLQSFDLWPMASDRNE